MPPTAADRRMWLPGQILQGSIGGSLPHAGLQGVL
jgi:hypothetical protein